MNVFGAVLGAVLAPVNATVQIVQGRNVGPLKEGPEDIKRFGDEG